MFPKFNLGRRFMMLIALAFCFCAPALQAQNVTFPEINTLTAENIFQATIEPLYGMLVILFGYLSGYLPVVKKFAPFARVIAFALALGIGLHLFGGASIWKIAFTYFLSSGLYAVILKHILPSPGPVN